MIGATNPQPLIKIESRGPSPRTNLAQHALVARYLCECNKLSLVQIV